MHSAWLVRLYDHDGTKVQEYALRGRRGLTPGGIQFLNVYRRLRSPGGWNIGFNAQEATVADWDIDYIVEFWRRDYWGGAEYTTWLAGLPFYRRDISLPGWYRQHVGFVRTKPAYIQNEDGTYTATIYGRGINDLLLSDFIDWPEGSSEAQKSGATETVAKEFVDENIGPSAGTDDAGNSRVRSGVSIEADAGNGDTWSGDRANKNLYDVLRELAEYAPTTEGADFNLVATSQTTFEFQWRSGQWGQDKTKDNAGGLAPAILTSRLHTATNVRASHSYLDEVNVVTIMGGGVGTVRKKRTVAYDESLDLSPWARRAIVRPANNAQTDTAMDAVGYAALLELRSRAEVTLEPVQRKGFRYPVHWEEGDLVTVIEDLLGVEETKKVIGVRFSVNAEGEEIIVPELVDP